MINSKQGRLSAVFTGLATGAASGALFGTSVNFISDLFGHSLGVPETIMNGFAFGTVPAVAMTGSVCLGSYILNKMNEHPQTRLYATAHIAALLLGASAMLGNNIGSINAPYIYNHGIFNQPPSHRDLGPLLRAFDHLW